MALFFCSACRKEVSVDAPACPECNQPIAGFRKHLRSFIFRCLSWLALRAAVAVFLVMLMELLVVMSCNVLDGAGHKNEIAKAYMKANIVSAVKQYAIKNKTLPITVRQLLAPPVGQGSLTEDAIIDPWNREYTITYLSQDLDHPVFAVICWGPDGNEPIVVKSE
jgi:hypothetical protein